MSTVRIFWLGLLVAALAPASCGTNAKGIEDCRSIELARCSAAAPCGIVTDVDACQRFYRDQCLHGLAVAPPGSTHVAECADAIRAAGACAASTDGTECQAPVTPDNACKAVEHPEKLQACSFLDPEGTEGEGGSDSGSGGSSGGGGASAGGSPDSSGGSAGATASGGAPGGESGGTGASAGAG